MEDTNALEERAIPTTGGAYSWPRPTLVPNRAQQRAIFKLMPKGYRRLVKARKWAALVRRLAMP